MSETELNDSTVYPKAVKLELSVVTIGFPVGARPTIVPVSQFFKSKLEPAAVAVDC